MQYNRRLPGSRYQSSSSMETPSAVTESFRYWSWRNKKQNFIIGCLYSERPVFTVMMRVNSSSLGHAVMQLSSHWLGDQIVTHKNDLANFGQSLDNAPFGICMKSPDHDFQKLLVICWIICQCESLCLFKSNTLGLTGAIREVLIKMTRNQNAIIVEIIGNGSDRAWIKAHLDSTEERWHVFKN